MTQIVCFVPRKLREKERDYRDFKKNMYYILYLKKNNNKNIQFQLIVQFWKNLNFQNLDLDYKKKFDFLKIKFSILKDFSIINK